MLIRCTVKLQKEMGIKKSGLTSPVVQDEGLLGDWYANLFYLARRKCVIFINAMSYYAFVAFDVNREQIRRLDELFIQNLGRQLYENNFSPEAINKALGETKIISYGKTIDRHVLGVINQMIYDVIDVLNKHGQITTELFKEVVEYLPRSMRQKDGEYIIPLEEIQPLLEDEFPITRKQAKEIARNHPSSQKRRIDHVASTFPVQFEKSDMPDTPCWYVAYRLADEPLFKQDFRYMCVCRATGKVLYDEGDRPSFNRRYNKT